MASNVDAIYARLAADGTLLGTLSGSVTTGSYTGLLTGGLYTHRLKRDGPQATTLAFTPTDKGRIIRPSAFILDDGDDPHLQELAIPTAYNQDVLIYLYAYASQSGKVRIKDCRKRIHTLLNDWTFVTEDGPIAFVKYVNRLGIRDSEQFTEAAFDYCRYRITSRYENAV